MKKVIRTGSRRLPLSLACLLLFAAILTAFSGCRASVQNDIYIFFTGDAHCADDENLGYAGVKALVEETRDHISEYVTLVDTGDAVWGDFLGNNSEGGYIVELMNDVGYDYAVFGNHEFDYGMERLAELMALSEATYLGCNLRYTGDGRNLLDASVPYAIEQYGDTKVGFIGVTTPLSITQSTPTFFMENGEFVYDFYQSDSAAFYAVVQAQIDACIAEGAEHVILLTHLGDGEEYGSFSSEALIAATDGADAVLDGHAHSVIPCRMVTNKAGERIPLASTGTGLQNIGQLVITPAGGISITLINGDIARDAAIDAKITAQNETYDAIMAEVVGHSDFALSINDSATGERIVRNREATIGNFCADAYRADTGADIAFVNGGGLRASLPAGDITYGDLLALHPYGNNICVVYATGQEIADALEFSCRHVLLDEDGRPTVESGAFLHVSGLTFTVDTSVVSTVVTDENGLFDAVEGARRVRDILVETEDGYVPLDPEKTYTVASFSYTLRECGDGYTMFADNEYAIPLGKFDYETLTDYLADLENNTIPERYAQTEGRIRLE